MGWAMGLVRALCGVFALLIVGAQASSAWAMVCWPVAQAEPRFMLAALRPEEVGITFLGHASFLLESPKGVTIVTDSNGVMRPKDIPDIVTMNNAHITHYTPNPEPEIKYVLRGWDEGRGAPVWDVGYKDVQIRNVPTNVRDWSGATRENGNSIFVFSVGDLCIAHLGHLHHLLTDAQVSQLGQVDILLVPVDGSYTLSQEDMFAVIEQIKPQLIIPMHYFNQYTLARFLERAAKTYPVRNSESPSLVLARARLPKKPEILVLPGQ